MAATLPRMAATADTAGNCTPANRASIVAPPGARGRAGRSLRFWPTVLVLLALVACSMPQVGVVPFTPTSDQGGGEAIVQGWLARHRPRPTQLNLDSYW